MGNDGTKKILRPDRSRADRAFSKNESRWDNEIGRMRKLIDNHVQALGEYEGEKGREKLKKGAGRLFA